MLNSRMYHARWWCIFSSRPINTLFNLIIPRFGKRSGIGHVHYCDRQLAPLQPWSRSTYWVYHVPDSEYQKIHRVEPIRQPVLRYQGGESISMDQLVGPTSRSKRKPKHVVLKPSERSVARRLLEQQTFSQDEPPIRASRRVHRTYWEDVWETRREERSWKSHREHQWR